MRIKRIISVAIICILIFSVLAFATTQDSSIMRSVTRPSLKVIGTTAYCAARVTYSGASIDATLELWQGGTCVASWYKTGNGSVTFNETETIVHGLTYTLTISGTVNGVAFTPQSVTKTL